MTLLALKQPPQQRNACCWWHLQNVNIFLVTNTLLLQLLLLTTTTLPMMVSNVNAQEYYFPNTNNQNRFVPSSQYQNTRQYRGNAGQPGSYQEQILFIGNEGKPHNQALTSPAYSPFGQQHTGGNRNSDYYDISPRPFGVPGSASGSSFTRSKSFKPSSSLTQSSSGFVPQRANVPHQQTQFLQQFNEPTNGDKPQSSNRLSSSAARPFGNGGFQPSSSRNRPAPATYNNSPDSAVGPVTPQQLPFRNSRNRFQPNSALGSTSTSSTTEATTPTKRFNRYGSSRNGFKAPPSPSSIHSNNPELSRIQNKFSSRRPAFISREVNEPIQNSKIQKPYSPKTGRVKIPLKNQLLKQQISSSSTPFRPALPQTQSARKENESTSEEYDEDVPQQNQLAQDEVKEPLLEKLQLHEAEEAPVVENVVTDASITTTISPSNENDESVVQSTESISESKESNHEGGDDDEYKNYSDEYAQSQEELDASKEENTTPASVDDVEHTTTKHAESEEEYHEVEEEEEEGDIKATVAPLTEATPLKTEDTVETSTTQRSVPQENDQITATVLITTTESSPTDHRDESSGEYEEYEEEVEDDSGDGEHEGEHVDHTTPANKNEGQVTPSSTSTTLEPGLQILEIISVVTSKSYINGSTIIVPVTPRSTTMSVEEEAIFSETKSAPASDEYYEDGEETTTPISIKASDESVNNATEGYVVVASIQTSRSINGARFLPFPAIQQEESKKSLSELERNAKAKANKKDQDSVSEQTNESDEVEVSPTSTEQPPENTTLSQPSSSTESIIDKLDRVQSELSSGLLAGKYPIISQMDVSTQSTTSTAGSKFVPNIRKFQPKTTSAPKVKVHHFDESAPKVKVHHFDETEMDELTALLPVGFKSRPSYKNRKITTTTTTTTTSTEKPTHVDIKKPVRNSTISRSFKNGAVAVQDVSLAGLLPKGYKMPPSTEKPKNDLVDILSKIKFEDNLDKLLPKDYKPIVTTPKPAVTMVDDISKFLPPGYKLRSTTPTPAQSPSPTTTTTEPTNAPTVTINEDINKFLPPGYKAPTDDSKEKPNESKPVETEDISKFLPPGYKLRTTKKPSPKLEPESIDIAQLLPKGYKPPETKDQKPDDIFKKIEFKEVASLLPPDFKINSTDVVTPISTTTISTTEKTIESAENNSSSSGFKVVFPKGIHKRIGAHRLTTPKSTESSEGPTSSSVVIKKGPPTRATTEFTGWPTPSTTPISIEKLLEQAKTATIDIDDLLTSSTTTTTTTTTSTTTTTTTPKPTKPGFCTNDCDLAATIKIIDGVSWKPELLDHNTVEWKNLAREVEAQLNEVYSTAPQLNKWYKKVRIDSFSKGSVLVDYYVELANINEDVNTLEIKKLFHEALTPQSIQPPETENETDNDDNNEHSQQYTDGKPEEKQLVKETFLMGKYVIDPVATDFSVIPKSLTPNVEFAEEDLLIPQWAIVVIVIGVGSLAFVVIFGVTVLLNRQKRAKKTPIPLTNDMLNELKINHMGGVDNYGVDDFYNIDDAWNDTKQPIKPKRFTNSMHDSSGSNIYDSWRSTRHGDYYYDSQNNYSQKGDSLQRSLKHHPHSQYNNAAHSMQHQQMYGHQYPDAFADAHQMYTYNNQANGGGRSRYPRDYDPDF